MRLGGRGLRVGVVAGLVLVATACVPWDLQRLSSDAFGGRDNGTPGSVLAQDHLFARLQSWTVGANPAGTGRAAYEQQFAGGTNIIGIVPGTDLADEYVMIGAHYDGHGSSSACRGKTAADSICNGATDNATGAAIVVNVAQRLAQSPVKPRRSVIVALWDREEDGLLGSQAYVANPLVPLADTVAYVNLDIQGANLRPSLRNNTFAIGAETGGAVLQDALAAAIAPTPLDTRAFSIIFGQGRSDHAVLVGAGVPSVFFSDATGPCYHTVGDDLSVVDMGKLIAQFETVTRITTDLANRDDAPTLVTGLPLATYADAVTFSVVTHEVFADLATFSAADQQTLLTNAATVDQVVAAGPAAFDDNAMISVLLAAQASVTVLGHGPCDGFLAPS